MRALRIKLAVTTAAAAGALSAAALAAGTISGDDPEVTACYNFGTGALRAVGAASECRRSSEGVLTWSKEGPVGPRGEKGDKGDKGDVGPQGPAGTVPDQSCPEGEYVAGIQGGQIVCRPLPGEDPGSPDEDTDGFTVVEGDCDDTDATVNPGEPERPGNGKDDDCNPETPDTEDADGDGYTVAEGDCNDDSATVNPGAIEEPGNLIDDDCDGLVDE